MPAAVASPRAAPCCNERFISILGSQHLPEGAKALIRSTSGLNCCILAAVVSPRAVLRCDQRFFVKFVQSALANIEGPVFDFGWRCSHSDHIAPRIVTPCMLLPLWNQQQADRKSVV